MSVPVTEDLLPAFLQQSGKVIYSDGNQHGSLYWLNFCHFCKQLRDQNSMYYEVEMKRCTNCTETFTNAEGNEKETGCPQCFDCPICSQQLVLRTTVSPSEGTPEGGEKSGEKRYHLICQNCRWSTRGAGIPDETKLPNIILPWKFRTELIKDSRDAVSSLSDYYQGLSINEKGLVLPKGKEKPNRRSRIGYNSLLTDKYKLVSVAQKRISGVGTAPPDMVILEAKAPKTAFLDKLTESTEEELFQYLSPHEADRRLSLDQRIAFPLEQPKSASNVYPRNRPLNAKIAWRCKSCQHVLVKKDFAAHSVKFKMISAAPQLVPNIKPCQPNLIVGQVCDFVVTISNPLNHPVSMSFSIPSTDEPLPRWVTGQPVYGLKVPPAAITLLNRNCASGIDEKGKEAVTTLPDDDSMIVAFRRLYTIGVKFSCIPMAENVDNWVSFNIRYDFHENQTTVFDPEKSSNSSGSDSGGQISWIYLRIDMNLGKPAS